jgi:hypothetical protein
MNKSETDCAQIDAMSDTVELILVMLQGEIQSVKSISLDVFSYQNRG